MVNDKMIEAVMMESATSPDIPGAEQWCKEVAQAVVDAAWTDFDPMVMETLPPASKEGFVWFTQDHEGKPTCQVFEYREWHLSGVKCYALPADLMKQDKG